MRAHPVHIHGDTDTPGGTATQSTHPSSLTRTPGTKGRGAGQAGRVREYVRRRDRDLVSTQLDEPRDVDPVHILAEAGPSDRRRAHRAAPCVRVQRQVRECV